MSMIGGAAIIRSKGACKAFADAVMNEEIKKMSEQYEREIMTLSNELESRVNKENMLLTDRLAVVRSYTARRCGLFNTIRDKLEVAWAFIWCLGVKYKLWCDDEQDSDSTM